MAKSSITSIVIFDCDRPVEQSGDSSFQYVFGEFCKTLVITLEIASPMEDSRAVFEVQESRCRILIDDGLVEFYQMAVVCAVSLGEADAVRIVARRARYFSC